MATFARITEKLIEYYPGWKNIVGKTGYIVEQTNSSVKIHITTDGKTDLGIEYTVPSDCIIIISNAEAVEDALFD